MDLFQDNITIIHQEKIHVQTKQIELDIIEAKIEGNEITLFPYTQNQKVILLIHQGKGCFYQSGQSFALFPQDGVFVDLDSNFYMMGDKLHFTQYVITFEDTFPLPNTPLLTRFSDQTNLINLLTEFKIHLNDHQLYLAYSFLYQGIHLFTQGRDEYSLPPILSAISYIEEHFQEELHLEEISQASGFSKYHFIRLFQAETNKTPYQYLLDRRITHAKYLLVNTDQRIKDIALKSGFQSEVHFNYAFKKETSFAPNQYRKLTNFTSEHSK